jgi:hypothetical protein
MAAPEAEALQEVEAVPEVGGTAPEAKVIPEACVIPQARAVVLKRIQIGAADSQARLLTQNFIPKESAEVTSQVWRWVHVAGQSALLSYRHSVAFALQMWRRQTMDAAFPM